MASKIQKVGAAEVRKHFGQDSKRGRLPKALIEQYEAETGHKVETHFKPERTVTLTVGKATKSGYRTRKVTKTLAEVRTLAGEAAGTRGVLSAKAVAQAEAALSDPRPDAE